MLLLQPSPGHCVDRQTILQLKCHNGLKRNLNIQPFVDENNALQTYLEKNWFMLAKKNIQHAYDTAFTKLKGINTELWALEDEIRRLLKIVPEGDVPDVAGYLASNGHMPEVKRLIEIALYIPQLNDRRAQAVAEINALFGINTMEKVYNA